VTTFDVRPVRDGDVDGWLPMWEAYTASYGRTGPTALPAEITATTSARFLDPTEPVHALVADTGNGLVGPAHYLFHRSTTAIAYSCHLQDLFTTEEARGKGVGRALIEAVSERAEGSGRLHDAVADRTEFIVYAKSLA